MKEISKYSSLVDLELNLNGKIKEPFQVILNAINDWPTIINNLNEFEIELNGVIPISDHFQIKIYLEEIDILQNAWYVEAVTELLTVYDYYLPHFTINQIIHDLIKKLNYDLSN